MQLALFTKKKQKAFKLIDKLKPEFNVGSFTESQRLLEWRVDKIKKAIKFCDGQIREAQGVLDV